MTDRELMQQALFALLESKPIDINDPAAFYRNAHAIDALDVRLSHPEEPDWYAAGFGKPQREWQGLTDEEILEEYRQSYGDDGNLTDIYFAHAIEAKLKEKNT